MLLHLSNNRELIDDLVDDELMTATRSEAEDLTSEIGALRIQVQTLREEIEIIWKDQKQAAFELVAVFMHRGQFSFFDNPLITSGVADSSSLFRYGSEWTLLYLSTRQ